jgi:hypothetical protein
MIELRKDRLVFSFPEVHPEAVLEIGFQRTLRIPDDDREYFLPPGLGRFPLRHVDDHSQSVPRRWLDHGGVMLPMYQSEAMWLNFEAAHVEGHATDYPFAIKLAAGKVNAVTGEGWSADLQPDPQDYVVAPEQPWLDGFCVEKGIVRQFVAMPLGSGYSAEEQITGEAEHGGLQIMVFPMKREAFDRRFPRRRVRHRSVEHMACMAAPDMALAPGGKMRQEIYDDPYGIYDWETHHFSRCFVHIANSLVWRAITGQNPPTTPPTAKEYTRAGLPWFDYYDDRLRPLEGSTTLKVLKSVATIGRQKKQVPLPENDPVEGEKVISLRKGLAENQVREGRF